MAAFLITLPALLIVALVIFIGGPTPLRRLGVDESVAPVAVSTRLRVQLRNVSAMIAAFVAAVAILLLPSPIPAGERVTFAGPLLVATIAIAVFAIVPAFREVGERRAADLVPRGPRSFGARADLAITAILAVSLIAAVVTFGQVAHVDGRSFLWNFHPAPVTSTTSPFPGWLYGLPLLGALLVLLITLALTVRRLVAAPRPSDEGLREADAAVRVLALRVVLRTASSAIALTLAITLLLAAQATHNAIDGSANGLPTDGRMVTIVVLEVVGGGILAVGAVVLIGLALRSAVRNPFALQAREPQASA